MTDNVNSPPHYKSDSGVECITFAERMPFNFGNPFKYLWRFDGKNNPEEDVEKALYYLERQETMVRMNMMFGHLDKGPTVSIRNLTEATRDNPFQSVLCSLYGDGEWARELLIPNFVGLSDCIEEVKEIKKDLFGGDI